MLQEGQEILEGRFKIIKKLGSGAFGEIFKGNDHLSFSPTLWPVMTHSEVRGSRGGLWQPSF